MILIDAGPLVALCSRNDTWHLVCGEVLSELHEPLLTVWPALAEAMHLLNRSAAAQEFLLEWVSNGAVNLATLDRTDVPRIREVMHKYRDLPMDLADAALVRVAERERIRRIFTVDRRDFEIYRPYRLGRFEIIP